MLRRHGFVLPSTRSTHLAGVRTLLRDRLRSLLRTAFFGVVVTIGAPALAAVPSPLVTGPIASTGTPGDTSHDYIFFATTHDLPTQGYVEQEYFIEGTANRYTTLTNGTTGVVVDGGHPIARASSFVAQRTTRTSTVRCWSNGRT